MSTLVDSSGTTLEWLNQLRKVIINENLQLIYKEVKYWASFQSIKTNRNIVLLHPQKNQIRLFTKMEVHDNKLLETTPSTDKWAQYYPSIFVIRDENMILAASKLIVDSYSKDLNA